MSILIYIIAESAIARGEGSSEAESYGSGSTPGVLAKVDLRTRFPTSLDEAAEYLPDEQILRLFEQWDVIAGDRAKMALTPNTPGEQVVRRASLARNTRTLPGASHPPLVCNAAYRSGPEKGGWSRIKAIPHQVHCSRRGPLRCARLRTRIGRRETDGGSHHREPCTPSHWGERLSVAAHLHSASAPTLGQAICRHTSTSTSACCHSSAQSAPSPSRKTANSQTILSLRTRLIQIPVTSAQSSPQFLPSITLWNATSITCRWNNAQWSSVRIVIQSCGN